MPDMNMKYLRSFLAFVEERSTTKAAQRLGIRQHNIIPHITPSRKRWANGCLKHDSPAIPAKPGARS